MLLARPRSSGDCGLSLGLVNFAGEEMPGADHPDGAKCRKRKIGRPHWGGGECGSLAQGKQSGDDGLPRVRQTLQATPARLWAVISRRRGWRASSCSSLPPNSTRL